MKGDIPFGTKCCGKKHYSPNIFGFTTGSMALQEAQFGRRHSKKFAPNLSFNS
jgi:hypothetical protein